MKLLGLSGPYFRPYFPGAVAVALLIAGTQLSGGLWAQTAGLPSSTCVLSRKIYICDLASFRQALAGAKTVAIQTDPQDSTAHRQLKELIASLGKGLAPVDQAEIVLDLEPTVETGISIGPGDNDLATLRVYARNPDGRHRELLWSETYRGQADRPWPTIVYSLIRQFQDRLHPQ